MSARIYRGIWLAAGLACLLFVFLSALFCVRLRFPRPYLKTVQGSGLPPSLVYAVIKAESGFCEDAVSRAGAVGIMQIKPSTAEFICRKQGMAFVPDRLKEGEYNIVLGCGYLSYLIERFEDLRTALCAYNAGEGRVSGWLREQGETAKGGALHDIPYAETRNYVKKVEKFCKFYRFFYG